MPSSASSKKHIYPLSLHDALPIYPPPGKPRQNIYYLDTRHPPGGVGYLNNRYRSEEHTSELQSLRHLVCRLLLAQRNTSTLFPYTTLFRSTHPLVSPAKISII